MVLINPQFPLPLDQGKGRYENRHLTICQTSGDKRGFHMIAGSFMDYCGGMLGSTIGRRKEAFLMHMPIKKFDGNIFCLANFIDKPMHGI
jgi:hypothetical protein